MNCNTTHYRANSSSVPGDPTNGASDFVAEIDWGDGTTTAGTVSGSNGSFSILGSHTYAASGDNTVTVFMNDDFPDSAFAFANSTAVSGFAGQVDLSTATEGTALTNATVASFADVTANLPASDYTATIDWGDGTTTTGTVAGSNGSFSIQGTHTYADEGDVPAVVTVTRTTDNTVITAIGTIAVVEGDLLTPTPTTIGGQPGVLISNVVVATFADIYTANVAGDFSATIDWGDGTTSAGTVSGGGGTFSVLGSHTYATAGRDTVSVTLNDDPPGTATATAVSTAYIGFAGELVLTDATERVALLGNTQVATFTDGNLADTAGSFTATIDWGDGTTTTGTIVGSNGSFTVDGGHTYADEGSFSAIATVTRTSDNATVVASGGVAVAEDDVLSGQGTTISGNPGQVLSNVVVATFSDTDTIAPASDFSATIDWGDGTTSAGTVSGAGGTFSVAGTHTYVADGHDAIIVTLSDDPPGTAAATANSVANIGLAGQLVLTSATERVALPSNTTVATYVDNNGADTAGSFTATINWGDGTTSAGTVSGASGSFTISGGHTYADEGNFSVIATLTRTSDHETGTSSGNVAIAEHDVLSAQGTTLTGNSGQILSNVVVATFSDTDAAAPASDFTATVDWGDGTTTAGTIAGSNGAFSVSGTHAYATAGRDTVTVKVTDDAPGTAAATATTTVNVLDQPPVVTAGNTVGYTQGAAPAVLDAALALSDPDNTTLAGAHVTITSGFVSGDVLGFANQNGISGSYDPATHVLTLTGIASVALYQAALESVTFSSTSDNPTNFGANPTRQISWVANDGSLDSAAAITTVNLTAVPPPSPGPDFDTVLTGDFDGNSQPDLVFHRSSDGATEILLGSGLTFSGGILSNPGVQNGNLKLVGVGDFNGDGNSDLVFLNQGIATPVIQFLDGTTPIGGGPPSVNPFDSSFAIVGVGDFNGDGKADLVWHRGSDGLSEIQFLNGTTSIGGGVINNPGFTSDWQIVGVGDFNGDGHSDLVYHDQSLGLTEIQFLNGITPIGGGPINNPTFQTPDWQVVGVGDFNGDGHPDLVFHDAATGVTAIQLLNGLTPIGGGVINNPAFQSPDFQVVGVGDFNGDGHPDLVFHDVVIGVTEIQLLNGITPIGGGPITLH